MAVSTTILAERNNLNTPAKPVPVLLSAYMEIYRYLEGDQGLRNRGIGDLMDRMNTERFPIQQNDLMLTNVKMLTIFMCQGTGTYCRHLLAEGQQSTSRSIKSTLRKLSLRTSRDKRAMVSRSIWERCEEVDFRSFFILDLLDRLRSQLVCWLDGSDFMECCYPIPVFTLGLIPSEDCNEVKFISHFDKKTIIQWISDTNMGFERDPAL